MPYVKSRQVFRAPALDGEELSPYALNPAIAGKSLAQFDEPARTVALYEGGPDGQPVFRFGGKAVVGFVDGHVELVGPEEAAKLGLKPKSIKAS